MINAQVFKKDLADKIIAWLGKDKAKQGTTVLAMVEAGLEFLQTGAMQFLEALTDGLINGGVLVIAFLMALNFANYTYTPLDFEKLVGVIIALSVTLFLFQLFMQVQQDYPVDKTIESHVSLTFATIIGYIGGQIMLTVVIAQMVMGSVEALFTTQTITIFFALWVNYAVGIYFVEMLGRAGEDTAEDKAGWVTVLRGVLGGVICFIGVGVAFWSAAEQVPILGQLLNYGLLNILGGLMVAIVVIEVAVGLINLLISKLMAKFGNDGWSRVNVEGYQVAAKIASDGRIIKLFITQADGEELFNYERELEFDRTPTGLLQDALKALRATAHPDAVLEL